MSIEEKVINIVAKRLRVDVSKVTLETNIRDDLNADSLDASEIVFDLEDEFGVELTTSVVKTDLRSIQALIDFVKSKLH